MSLRRLGVLQWFGILGAALAWTGQHLAGVGVAGGTCAEPGDGSGDAWQLTALAVGCLVVIAAEVAAGLVYRRTRGSSNDEAGPRGRLQFLAAAALVANVLFLVIMILDGIASVVATACAQA